MEAPAIGDRVRLIEDVSLYPFGLIPSGSEGVVVSLTSSEPGDVSGVLLDDEFDFLDKWDKELQVGQDPDESDHWAMFEPKSPSLRP